MTYKTPGVYVEEISLLPPFVAEVATAIPAFIGHTDKAVKDGEDLKNKPTRITSLLEYEQAFGGHCAPAVEVTIDTKKNNAVKQVKVTRYYLYESLRLYFDNGGGPCYIVSVGDYKTATAQQALKDGLDALEKYDEPTIIVMPDAVRLEADRLYALQGLALAQCGKLGDRVAVLDLPFGPMGPAVEAMRNAVPSNNVKYGAVYGPWIVTAYDKAVPFALLEEMKDENSAALDLATLSKDADYAALLAKLKGRGVAPKVSEAEEKQLRDTLYSRFAVIGNIVRQIKVKLSETPPCGAVAGVYAFVDSMRGVWKAPANVSFRQVLRPVELVDDAGQERYDVDVTGGKSINVIRAFTGRGTLVWGARTLAGNDTEWRYVNVRRFFNMVEESVKKSTAWAVFEPNAAPLWVKVKGMIENYLTKKWRDGALAGTRPDDAFYVKVGLGQTMTAQDILEGWLNVEIGMAVVRPAEFIILKFSHMMQKS